MLALTGMLLSHHSYQQLTFKLVIILSHNLCIIDYIIGVPRSLHDSNHLSCHCGESYMLELHLLDLLLKLEFLHLPGSAQLLMSLLRDHEMEVVLVLVLTRLPPIPWVPLLLECCTWAACSHLDYWSLFEWHQWDSHSYLWWYGIYRMRMK